MCFLAKPRPSLMIHEKLKFVTAEMRKSERKLRWNPVSYFFFSVIYENVCSEKRSHESHLMKSRLHCGGGGGGGCRGKRVTVSQEFRFINPGKAVKWWNRSLQSIHLSLWRTDICWRPVPLELRLRKHTHSFITRLCQHLGRLVVGPKICQSVLRSKCSVTPGPALDLIRATLAAGARVRRVYRFTDSNPRGGKFDVFLSKTFEKHDKIQERLSESEMMSVNMSSDES